MNQYLSETQRWALATLLSVDEMTLLDVIFNGVPMKLPAGTLLTMAHCIHLDDNKLYVWVETAHNKWMIDRVADDGIFLDIGAATGASLLPVALKKPSVRVIAFEPTLRASKLLRVALAANSVEINLLSAAAYSQSGVATFKEFRYSPDAVPYLTETSSISSDGDPDERAIYYKVPTVRVDDLALVSEKIVFKIDVEGAEVDVLKGSVDTLANNDALLSIDIHGDTETPCREILEQFGYSFTRVDHVLLCEKLESAGRS